MVGEYLITLFIAFTPFSIIIRSDQLRSDQIRSNQTRSDQPSSDHIRSEQQKCPGKDYYCCCFCRCQQRFCSPPDSRSANSRSSGWTEEAVGTAMCDPSVYINLFLNNEWWCTVPSAEECYGTVGMLFGS